MFSGPSSGPHVFEAADSVGVPGFYARFCIWPSENTRSTSFVNNGKKKRKGRGL
jgi:hypothetical protein